MPATKAGFGRRSIERNPGKSRCATRSQAQLSCDYGEPESGCQRYSEARFAEFEELSPAFGGAFEHDSAFRCQAEGAFVKLCDDQPFEGLTASSDRAPALAHGL